MPSPNILGFVVASIIGEPPTILYAEDQALGARWIEVRLDDVTLIAMETEVTRDQWVAVTGAQAPSSGCEAADCPVGSMSPFAFFVFANRVSEIEGAEVCYDMGTCWSETIDADLRCTPAPFLHPGCTGYRVPTDEERLTLLSFDDATRPTRWATPPTYAEFAGSDRARSVLAQAWLQENSGGRMHPVAQRVPDAAGFFDLVGNVGELSYLPAERTRTLVDLNPWEKEQDRLAAGGCAWFSKLVECDPHTHARPVPFEVPLRGIGLRLVRRLDH